MKRYEVIAHTADIRLLIEGSSLEELFNAALEGMANIMVVGQCTTPFQHQQNIDLESMDTTTLLIDFLSSVLTESHVSKMIFCSATFTSITQTSLQATVYGNSIQSFDKDIKAVTYHEAEIIKNKHNNYETVIIFDI